MISHLNKKNKPKIVDISTKKITNRMAIAQGIIKFSKPSFKKIESLKTKKGEIKSIAIIAGILGAKKTSELIPLCHPLALTSISLDLECVQEENLVRITSTCRLSGQTGVEMEALTSASVAALTIYDMCKSVDRGMKIIDVRLTEKSGGKSGTFRS